jgi:hypothetical protein
MAVDITKLTTDRSYPPDSPVHAIPTWLDVSFTAAEVEALNFYVVYAFPAAGYIKLSSFFANGSDMDINATEGLDLIFGIGDVDGVIDTALYTSTSTEVEDAFSVRVGDLDAGLDPYVDVGGKYLIVEVANVAQTGAAGTIEFGFDVTRQVDKLALS